MSRRFTGGTLSSGVLYINGGYLSSATVPVTGFPFTMACWASVADATNFNPLMAISDDANANEACIVYVASEAVGASFTAGGAGYVVTTAITDNTPVFIAFVCESSTSKKLYVNGSLIGTITNTTAFAATYDKYYVGAEYRAVRYTAHDATIALPAVWNVALTEAEVKRHAAGVYPEVIRGSSIVALHGLFRACSPEPDISGGTNDLTVAGTGTSATGASGPTINYTLPTILPRNAWSAQIMANSPYTTYQYKSASVTSGAAVSLSDFGFSASEIAKAKCAIISVLTGNVMMSRLSGLTATSTVGELILANTAIMVEGATDVQAINMIAQGTTATVTIFLQN